MLAILALLGFVGCRWGFDELQPPKGFAAATPKCGWIHLSWQPVANSPNYDLVRIAFGNETLIYHGPATSFDDNWILDGPAWVAPSYKIRTIFSPGYLSDYSAPITPDGVAHALLINAAIALLPRSNYTGFVGMEIQIKQNLFVCGIGRYRMDGNGTNPNPLYTQHYLRIIDAARDTEVAFAELVTHPAGNMANHLEDPNSDFLYALIPHTVLLTIDEVNQGRFYVVSQERDMTGMSNPESWNDSSAAGGLPVIPTSVAVVLGAVMGDIGGWVRQQSGSYSFGPVNILYQIPTIF
jgi:hypothetical protein